MNDVMVERLKRLLFLGSNGATPGHKGMPGARAMKAAGYETERELNDAVRFVAMLGPPAGTPEEYFDLEIEGDRIYAWPPAGLSRPPRLTLSEAAALLAATEPLRHSAGGVLESALKKVRKAVPTDLAPKLDELARAASIEAPAATKWHAILEDAIARRMEVALQYYSPARGKAGARAIEPRLLYTQSGRWYLAAWSVKDGKEKLYRLDRILDARIGSRCFGEHKGADTGARTVLFVDADLHPEVEVRFARSLARLAREQFGSQARDNDDGSVTVKTRMASETYAVTWALGYGGAVRIVSPAAWQKALERRAKERLAHHAA